MQRFDKIMSSLTNPQAPLGLSAVQQSLTVRGELLEETASDALDRLTESLTNLLKEQGPVSTELWQQIVELATFAPGYESSWLFDEGAEGSYRILTVMDEIQHGSSAAAWAAQLSDLWFSMAFSPNPLVPYDLRAMAAARISAGHPDKYQLAEQVWQAIKDTELCGLRSYEEKLALPSDGIDHLFPIPESLDERLAILAGAVQHKVAETRLKLGMRILAAIATNAADSITMVQKAALAKFTEQLADLVRNSFYSAEATARIESDAGSDFVRWHDYLVPWEQLIFAATNHKYTTSECLRLILLSGLAASPDAQTRQAVVAFHRAVLKTSGRSVIGLASGTFHVEHGTLANPAIFYLGRGAILGKGCIIDNVGGAVILQGAFLGGGFMPILIHTHKHISGVGFEGARERRRILPAIFLAGKNKRLPMSRIGLFETVDFLDSPSPVNGIEAFHVVIRKEIGE